MQPHGYKNLFKSQEFNKLRNIKKNCVQYAKVVSASKRNIMHFETSLSCVLARKE